MRYRLLFIAIILFSCKGKSEKPKQTYIIVLKRNEQSILSGGYEKRRVFDTIRVENDSIAFWEGIKKFTASLMAEEKLKSSGIKNLPYETEGIEVRNSEGVDIIQASSAEEKARSMEYIRKHTNQ